MTSKQAATIKSDLMLPLQALTAREAKNAVIRDLVVRAGMMRDSARSEKHDTASRNALLVAVRVLEVIIRDIDRNLGVDL